MIQATNRDAESRSSPTYNHRKWNKLRLIYGIGFFFALFLYGTMDITIHTSSHFLSDKPKVVVEVNLRKPHALDSLFQELLNNEKYRYTEGELDEERIVSDPLTDLVLDSEHADAVQNENINDLTELEMKQIEISRAIESYEGPVRVALYVGPGTTTNAKNNVPKVLNDCSNGRIKVESFADASLSNIGRLRHDVIFIPGGSAGKIFTEMGYQAKKAHRLAPQLKIRKFLEKGGGYVGICAGAYLAAGGKSGKSPFKISMFKTESGMLGDGYFSGTEIDEQFKREQKHQSIVDSFDENELQDSQLFYANGPIFKNETFESDEFPLTEPKVFLRMGNQAFLRILYGKKKSTHRRHQGLPLIVMNNYGKGKVVLSTAHPETSVHHLTYNAWSKANQPSDCSTQEAQSLMAMVYLAANRDPESINLQD